MKITIFKEFSTFIFPFNTLDDKIISKIRFDVSRSLPPIHVVESRLG